MLWSKRTSYANALCVAFIGLICSAAIAQEDEPSPRVETRDARDGVELIVNEINTDTYPDVSIFATVLRDNEPVTGLGPDDFRVREDEIDQTPLTVEAQLPPLSVVVTIDVSGSMADRMDATRVAAASFVEQLGNADAVQIVSFQREITTLTPMTTTAQSAIDAINSLVARGDTALYDGLMTSLDLVAERVGRRAVVLLSDGVDDDGTGQPLSSATVADILARAAEINVPVFVIGLGTEMDEAVLQEIARATGGQYLPAPDADQLAVVYDDIGVQLSGQYAIRYTSSLPADGTPRRLDLEFGELLASKDYVAPGEQTESTGPVVQESAPGTCPSRDAVEGEVAALVQAADRYDRDLITAANLREGQRTATSRMMTAFEQSAPQTSECVRVTLQSVENLYEEDQITATALRDLQRPLIRALSQICVSPNNDLEFLETCFRFYHQLYDEDLISATAQQDLRQQTTQPYRAALAQMSNIDAALERLANLYEDDFVTATTFRDLRDEILANE